MSVLSNALVVDTEYAIRGVLACLAMAEKIGRCFEYGDHRTIFQVRFSGQKTLEARPVSGGREGFVPGTMRACDFRFTRPAEPCMQKINAGKGIVPARVCLANGANIKSRWEVSRNIFLIRYTFYTGADPAILEYQYANL